MIAPIAAIMTSEQAASKSHNLIDLPIQITSIADEVTMKPKQSQAPEITPRSTVTGPISGEENTNQNVPAMTKAVIRFVRKFHNI